MQSKREQAIWRRYKKARWQLKNVAAEGGDLSELKAVQEELDILTDLTQGSGARSRRKVTLTIFSVLIAVAGILQLIHLKEVELSLQSSVEFLSLTSGSSSFPVLEGEKIESIAIDKAERTAAWCGTQPLLDSGECRHVVDLVLNGLTLHPRSQFAFSNRDDCLGIEISDGGLILNFSYSDENTPYGVGQEVLTLLSGDMASICGRFEQSLSIPLPHRLVLGREAMDNTNWPATLPSVTDGSLRFHSTDQEYKLVSTEVLIISDLRRAFLAIRPNESLEVSLSGNAATVSVNSGGINPRNIKPTLLSWAARSGFVKGISALLVGVASLLLTVSDYLKKLDS